MLSRWITVSLSAAWFAAAVHAQNIAGTIVGAVSDSSGAVVTGALVTATQTGTSAKRLATTDSVGTYTLDLLPPGMYQR